MPAAENYERAADCTKLTQNLMDFTILETPTTEETSYQSSKDLTLKFHNQYFQIGIYVREKFIYPRKSLHCLLHTDSG